MLLLIDAGQTLGALGALEHSCVDRSRQRAPEGRMLYLLNLCTTNFFQEAVVVTRSLLPLAATWH